MRGSLDKVAAENDKYEVDPVLFLESLMTDLALFIASLPLQCSSALQESCRYLLQSFHCAIITKERVCSSCRRMKIITKYSTSFTIKTMIFKTYS